MLYEVITLAGDLHYGYRAPGASTWQLTPVETTGTAGIDADIAVDQSRSACWICWR